MLRLFVTGIIAVALIMSACVAAFAADAGPKRKVTAPKLSGVVLKSFDAAAKRKVTGKAKVTAPSSGIAIPIFVPIFP